jgi:hypothetical protein
MFSDRNEDATEFESIVREFGCVRDEALGTDRYS